MPGVVDTPMQTHLRSQEPVAFRSTVEGHFPFVLPTKKTSGGWEYIRYLEPTWPLFWLEFRPLFWRVDIQTKRSFGFQVYILKLCRYPGIAWIENGIYNIAFQCLPWLWKFKSQFARCVAARNKNPARTLRATASSAVWAVSIVTMRNQLHHHQATGIFVGFFWGLLLHG